ncbi:MAG TPA: aldehyde dehydrogenase, partial [Thermopolyspora sp.]
MSRQITSVVGGKDVEAADAVTYDSIDPARTGEVVARVRLADSGTFAGACQVARAAQREWAGVPAP